MDIDKLLKALDNEDNSKLLNLTNKKLKEMKLEILKELDLTRNELIEYMTKLKDYQYIDEINEIRYGRFIRWIPLKDPENIHLATGGVVCEIKVLDTGVSIICKNFAKRHYHLVFDECLIFQKLSDQEQVLLSALDHLDSPNEKV